MLRTIQSFSLFDKDTIEVRADGGEDSPLLGIVKKLSESNFKAISVKGEVYVTTTHVEGVSYLLRKLGSKKKVKTNHRQKTLF